MKSIGIVVMVVVMGLVLSGIVVAAQKDQSVSLDKGKALFNDKNLGTNGKSCNDCHGNGKGLEKAASKKDLEQIVNACITQGLKGKALDVKSVEMQSLVSYIKSFSGTKKTEGKKAPVGC